MKKSVYYEYLKSCGLVNTSIFLLLTTIAAVFLILSNFWLSNWSNKNVIEISEKWYYYGVFFLLGFLNCKNFTKLSHKHSQTISFSKTD